MAGPVAILAELCLNGVWTDITPYVYQRDPVTIDGGSADEAGTPSPASLALTLNNRDGRFTPNYTGGAYYPFVGRDTQIRLTAQYTSRTGNFYTGYRFWGKVPEWPPLSDLSGRDVYVQITASGPLREIRQFGGKGSALARYYAALAGSAYAPAAYWPCEEDSFSTLIGPGVDGGQVMSVIAGTPTWNAKSDFNGSAPIGVLNNSTWDGLTGQFSTSGDDIYLIAGTYNWVASTATVDARVWGGGGGGENGGASGAFAGGGGGEYAREATLAVTPGQAYTVTVGKGGAGGALDGSAGDNPGRNGGNSSVQGDSVLCLAHGGHGGTSSGGGAGGTGSGNATHFPGAAGASSSGLAGSGGGSSAGTAAAGDAGSAGGVTTGGAGGSPPSGGGHGGHGGTSPDNSGATGGASPGGGGGAGAYALFAAAHSGQAGGGGKVELIYTPASGGTLPAANVIRFILLVPPHGGNGGKVLIRALTSSSVLARLDVLYQAGGQLQLKGFNGGGTQQFASANLSAGADGQPLMVSAELKNSGANVTYKLTVIKPGASSTVGSVSGTVTTAAVGNVTEVLAAPNADITKTAIGHISVQYALIDIVAVSKALDGHQSEMGIDRFIRLCNEQALDNAAEFSETNDHWGFRSGVQGWAGTNASVAQSAAWSSPADSDPSGVWSFTVSGTPAAGNYFTVTTAQAASISPGDRITISAAPSLTYRVRFISAPSGGFCNVTFTPDAAAPVAAPAVVSSGAASLLITSAGGAGQWFAGSPGGLNGQPVNVGDIVSAAADLYTPAALGAVQITINWYSAAAGTYLSTTSGAARATAAGDTPVVTVTGPAPATAAFFSVQVADNETVAAGKLLYADNVRVHPRMGPQTRREYHRFLQEIETLDQGIMKEARDLWGMYYRTRIRLINQVPAVTLDYSQQQLAAVPAPVLDDQKYHDDIVVHRHKGSKVRKTLGGGGGGSVGPNRRRKHVRTAAEADAQLLALAQHLLNLGTVTGERYPVIGACLVHPGAASIMSAIAGAEIGDFVKVINLPFWYPSATTSQLVIGYHEVITPFNWTIEWNCVPESPYELTATSIRRW